MGIFNFFSNKTQDLEDTHEEGAVEQRKLLKLSMDDSELTKQIDDDIQNSTDLYERMREVMVDNENYYLGDQLDRAVFSNEIPTAENLLYMATETQNAIMTSRQREPFVMASQNNDESRRLAQQTQQFLTWKWHDMDSQIKFEDWVRHAQIYRLGVFKFRYNNDTDDFEMTNVRPQRIVVEKNAQTEEDSKFIAEFKEDTLEKLISMFPNSKGKLIKEFGDKLATNIKYIEYWTNEFVVWKVNKLVIDKKKNPNWNWDEDKDDRKKKLDNLKKKWQDKTKKEKLENVLLNFFDTPQKPYVFLSLKSLNKSIYADTSDFDQGKVIQDTINIRKRTIDKAAKAGLGRMVISAQSGISKQEAKKVVTNPTAPLYLAQGRADDYISFIQPTPLSPVVFEDLIESKRALDDIMGLHSTTRGERGATETATGRQILREGDLGRIDLAVRRIDKKLDLVYAWMMQMAKVWYTDEHYIKIMGQEDAISYLKFSSDSIEDGQEVMVKSELTVEKSTQRQNVMTRAQLGLLDPLTMFEKFDDPNPKELTRRLVLFQQDPKLYLQQFAVDENTDGAERDPIMKAKQEDEKMLQGEQVPPFQGAEQTHLQEHSTFAQTDELQEQEPIIQQNFIQHVSAEQQIFEAQKQQFSSLPLGSANNTVQGRQPQGQPQQKQRGQPQGQPSPQKV